MLPKLQLSAGPATIEQPASLVAVSIDQLIPPPLGSASESVTPVAVAVADVFFTTIRKPIWSPAFTVPASAVLVTLRLGATTVIVSEPVTGGWLSAFAVAVFGYVPALAPLVELATWSETLAPETRSPSEQVSVCVGGEPPIEQLP